MEHSDIDHTLYEHKNLTYIIIDGYTYIFFSNSILMPINLLFTNVGSAGEVGGEKGRGWMLHFITWYEMQVNTIFIY